ncbi:MAG: MerC domain-containing protein, partial [Sphingomonas sp.]
MCHSDAMTTLAQPRLAHWIDARFDRMAIGLSGLCAVHCVASALFLAFMASVGAALLNPLWHEIGLSFAILFGVVALGRGFLSHG